MTTAADHAVPAEPEPPVPREPVPADDIVHECGLSSFPASDPPSWWADAGFS